MYLISCTYLYVVTTKMNIHLCTSIQASVYTYKMYMFVIYSMGIHSKVCVG